MLYLIHVDSYIVGDGNIFLLKKSFQDQGVNKI